MDTATIMGGWVAAGFTLFILTFLYRDNPLFKFGEHVFIGVTVGYTLVTAWYQYLDPKWWTPLFVHGKLLTLVPTFFGIMILARFIPRVAWLSRLAIALMVGFGSGVAIPQVMNTYLFAQVQGAVVPVVSRTPGGAIDTGNAALWSDFSAAIVVIGLVATLIYFFFSVEHKGPIHVVSRIGIYFLMISFGASFGTTVMGRNALLYGRFYDMKTFAGGGYHYATWVLLAFTLLALLVWSRMFGRERQDGR